MSRRRTDRRDLARSIRALVAAVWSSLLLLHLHLLLTAPGAAERETGERTGLLLASAFFLVQIVAPRLLRPRCPIRAVLAFALLAAFVHQDVRSAVRDGPESPRDVAQLAAGGAIALALAAAVAVASRTRGSVRVLPARRSGTTPCDRTRPRIAGRPSRRLSLLPRPPPAVALALR